MFKDSVEIQGLLTNHYIFKFEILC